MKQLVIGYTFSIIYILVELFKAKRRIEVLEDFLLENVKDIAEGGKE